MRRCAVSRPESGYLRTDCDAGGSPRASRIVGGALHRNPEPGKTPCHRVVFRDGSLAPGFAFGGPGAQRALLEAEGVTFLPDGRVDMARHPVDRRRMKRCNIG